MGLEKTRAKGLWLRGCGRGDVAEGLWPRGFGRGAVAEGLCRGAMAEGLWPRGYGRGAMAERGSLVKGGCDYAQHSKAKRAKAVSLLVSNKCITLLNQ